MNVQRVLIDNGWTIENRRKLISKIGEPQYNQVKEAFSKYRTIWRSDIVHADKIKLNQDGDSLCLSLGIHNASNITFIDNNINAENIVKSLHTLLGDVFAPKKINFNPSETMKKLFTPEFAPKRHIDENGYFVTTVIDRKTDGPVEVFVKEGFVNPYENSVIPDNPFISREKWEMFVKNPEIPSQYMRIGKRSFELDAYECKIKPGYMESKEGNKQFEGIGIRLHQLGFERMLQEDFNTVEIDSLYSAFPFHYKCGFRTSPDYNIYVKEEFMENINSWSDILKIPAEDLKNRLILKELEDCYEVDYKAIEELKKQICIKSDGIQSFEDTLMSIHGEYLREWIDLAESQPIILDYKKEFF